MANEYNQHSHVPRSIPELRSKWINLKKTVRKKLKYNRKERTKPAGEQIELYHLNPEEVLAKNIMKYAGPMIYMPNDSNYIEDSSRGSAEYHSENDKSEIEDQDNYDFSSLTVKQEMQIDDTEIPIQPKCEDTNLFDYVQTELEHETKSEIKTARIIQAEIQPPPLVESKGQKKRHFDDNETVDELKKKILNLEAEYIKLKIDRKRERYMQKIRREEELHLKKLNVLEAKEEYYKRKGLTNKK